MEIVFLYGSRIGVKNIQGI